MNWLPSLFNVSAVVTITANVIVMFYVFPAYGQTKRRAFLLIGFACLVGTFDTLCDRTIGRARMSPADSAAYHMLRQLTHFLAVALETTGIVLLTQSYLRSFQPDPPNLPQEGLPR